MSNRLIILYIKDYFESHKHLPVTLAELTRYLEVKGLSIGRKSLYKQIEALRLYGMDIAIAKGRNCAYFFQGYKEVNYD